MMQALATDLGPVYETLAPKAYSNQVHSAGTDTVNVLINARIN